MNPLCLSGTNRWTQTWVLLAAAGCVARLGVAAMQAHGAGEAARLLVFIPYGLWIGAIAAILREVRGHADELQKRIHMQAAATAFLVSVRALFALVALAMARVYRADLSTILAIAVITWAIALRVLSWKYA